MSSDEELIQKKELFRKKPTEGVNVDGFDVDGSGSDEERVINGLEASEEKDGEESLVKTGMGYEPPGDEEYGEYGQDKGEGPEGYDDDLLDELEDRGAKKSRKPVLLPIPENPGDVNHIRILKTTTNPTFVFCLGWPFLSLYTLLSPITSFHLGIFVACSASSVWAFVIGIQMLAEEVENISDCYLIPSAYLLIYIGVGGIAASVCAVISMCVQVVQHSNSSISREDPEKMFEDPDQTFSWYVSMSFQLLFLLIEMCIAFPTLLAFIAANVLLGFEDCEESDYHEIILIWDIVSFSLLVVGGAIPCIANCLMVIRT